MRIKKTIFGGMDAVEINTGRARLIAITGTGPRIAHLSTIRRGGESRNLLFWDTDKKYRRKDWLLRGGHRIWGTRPLADESEEAYASDNEPCDVHMGKRSLSLIESKCNAFGTRKSLTIRVEDDATFSVESAVINSGDMLWSGGAWALTATLPTKFCSYGIPLGSGGAWDIFAVVIPKAWAGHTTRINDSQISFTEHCLIFKPLGRETKRMIQAPQGLIGMTDAKEKISFLKHSFYERHGKYPLNCNLAFYNGPGNFMTEMESMGAEKTLSPGEKIRNLEIWALRDPVDWKKAKDVRI